MMQMNSKEKIFENKTKMSSEEQVSAILDRVCELEKKKARITSSSWVSLSQRACA